jgi:hypothetical protein
MPLQQISTLVKSADRCNSVVNVRVQKKTVVQLCSQPTGIAKVLRSSPKY